MSQEKKLPPNHGDTAQLLALATGTMLAAFVVRSFPVFRFWLGVVPLAIAGVGVASSSLFPHLRAWHEYQQGRVGSIRAVGPKFWNSYRLMMALGPTAIFFFTAVIGFNL